MSERATVTTTDVVTLAMAKGFRWELYQGDWTLANHHLFPQPAPLPLFSTREIVLENSPAEKSVPLVPVGYGHCHRCTRLLCVHGQQLSRVRRGLSIKCLSACRLSGRTAGKALWTLMTRKKGQQTYAA